MRGDVMLPAAVRAAADLDARAVGRRDQIRPGAQVLLEQPAEPARLRDRQPARFRARAARDVGDRAGFGEPEPGRGQTAIQLADVAGVHPAEHEILIRRDAHGAVAVGARQLAERRASARSSGRRAAPSPIAITNPNCFCGRTFVARQRAYASSPALKHRHDDRRDAGSRRRARRPRATRCGRPTAPHPSATPASIRSPADRSRASAPGRAAGSAVSSRSYSSRQRVQPERLDHELHPVPLLVLVVAEPLEDPQHRFGDAEDLRRRQELVQQPGRLSP